MTPFFSIGKFAYLELQAEWRAFGKAFDELGTDAMPFIFALVLDLQFSRIHY